MEMIGEAFTFPIGQYEQLIQQSANLYDSWLHEQPHFAAFEENKQELFLVYSFLPLCSSHSCLSHATSP
jgi:hypothetical protein